MKILVSLLTILLSLTACSTASLSPGGSKVRLTSNPEVVRNCSYIGQVQGTDHLNGGLLGQGVAEESAMRKIRNQAAEMGANTVHLVTKSTGFSGSAVRGEAYRCS